MGRYESRGIYAVPVQFRGEWNQKLRDCGTDLNDSRLIIGAHEITFYESAGPITSIRLPKSGVAVVVTSLTGEGEGEGPWSQTFRFRVSPDGEVLRDVTRGEPFVRLRCPPGAPERE